jgi:hypothetical protein
VFPHTVTVSRAVTKQSQYRLGLRSTPGRGRAQGEILSTTRADSGHMTGGRLARRDKSPWTPPSKKPQPHRHLERNLCAY